MISLKQVDEDMRHDTSFLFPFFSQSALILASCFFILFLFAYRQPWAVLAWCLFLNSLCL